MAELDKIGMLYFSLKRYFRTCSKHLNNKKFLFKFSRKLWTLETALLEKNVLVFSCLLLKGPFMLFLFKKVYFKTCLQYSRKIVTFEIFSKTMSFRNYIFREKHFFFAFSLKCLSHSFSLIKYFGACSTYLKKKFVS